MVKNDLFTGNSGICSILKLIVQFLDDFIVKGCMIKAKLKYLCILVSFHDLLKTITEEFAFNKKHIKKWNVYLRLTMISV